MAGLPHGYGLRIGALLSRGIHWRRSDAEVLAGGPQPTTDAHAASNGANGASAADQPPPEAEAHVEPLPEPEPASPRPRAAPASLAGREAAVEAYCLELCGGAPQARVAIEEVIASPRLSAPLSVVSGDELLRVTRATASGFAPAVPSPGRRSLAPATSECGFTLPRLARRANEELDRVSAAALAGHVDACLVCRAAEARFERSERAFIAVLGVASTVEQVPDDDKPKLVPDPSGSSVRGWSAAVATMLAAVAAIVTVTVLWIS